ncbi:hypothetical protein FHS77_003083 [Paenochrobactrum gallinarii]|uniref:DUF1612 domain-containing protein n=1 Tax=Paenochrobactrum gallinarii TaxID=643673 RepID=A0A841M8P1_9HYPH|nr:RHE_PE00001 family protein [Paenochrobactrum gallinarii]MBB6262508.1 hypothetical protein [Paenochrobactrum gallinarii]
MCYDINNLPLEALLSAIARAEDKLARLDEIIRSSPVGEGLIERGHFFDAVASMRIQGELVHVEDLVLHDAFMDVRAPTHELTIAHTILRARRRIALNEPSWAMSDNCIAALTGNNQRDEELLEEPGLPFAEDVENDRLVGDEADPLLIEMARMDAILDRSKHLIEGHTIGRILQASNRDPLIVGDLLLRDPNWDEEDRLSQWKQTIKKIEDLPATLGAALAYDAWESLEPMQRQHWVGSLLMSGYLRSKGKVASHLFCFNMGLKTIQRERRRSQNQTVRLLAMLDAMTAAAETGMKEIIRLKQAHEQMQRRLSGRRSSSSLPIVIDLILSRPIVSTAMVAKAAKLTSRGALNLINELGVRELTGRGRYKAWGVI